MSEVIATSEASDEFECFGSRCAVYVTGDGVLGSAREAVATVKRTLLGWHSQFSRFEPSSELEELNKDPRSLLPVSPLMARLADSIATVGLLTGGLVDGTLIDEVRAAGYADHLVAASVPLSKALEGASPRRPAGPGAREGWRQLRVDLAAGTVTRPPGLKLDSGGIAKGLFGDVLASELEDYESFAVDCGGDIRVGGAGGREREVEVAGPLDERIIHRFGLREGAVATSGIGKRSWMRPDGRIAHHLIDPGSGEPAFTGIVQVTAVAPSGVLAEALSKAALLSGPEGAERWLTRGGVIVYDDGSHRLV